MSSTKSQDFFRGLNVLTPKHRETRGCTISTVDTAGQVLKHQAISIHNAE